MKKLLVEEIRSTSLNRSATELNDVLSLLKSLNDKNNLNYLWSILAYRTLMSLVPLFDNLSSYNQRRKAVEKIILDKGIGNLITEEEIESLLEVANRLMDFQKGTGKKSLTDIHYLTKKQIFEDQNHRCLNCGVVFNLGESGKFDSPELDHIIPFSLKGNIDSNTRIICKRCNGAKSDDLSYITKGRLSLNDTIKGDNLEKLLYWALEISGSKCESDDCINSSYSSRLFIIKKSSLNPWSLSNVMVNCEKCATSKMKFP